MYYLKCHHTGIILSKNEIGDVFSAFESERVGNKHKTPDIDEFSRWIMNSDFKGAPKKLRGDYRISTQVATKNTNENVLREKLCEFINLNKALFSNPNHMLENSVFLSLTNDSASPINEQQARQLISTLEEKSSRGAIRVRSMIEWSLIGKVTGEATVLNPIQAGMVFSDSKIIKKRRFNWEIALKECQKYDTKKIGVVGRVYFVTSLELANSNSSLTTQEMSKLADRFCAADGMIQYVECFRTFAAVGKDTEKLAGCFIPSATETEIQRLPLPDVVFRKLKIAKNTATLGELSNCDDSIITVIEKCFQPLRKNWRLVKFEFKRAQISDKRGFMSFKNFVALLEFFGVRLTPKDFDTLLNLLRIPGMYQDVINFDRFLRFCSEVRKDGSKKMKRKSQYKN